MHELPISRSASPPQKRWRELLPLLTSNLSPHQPSYELGKPAATKNEIGNAQHMIRGDLLWGYQHKHMIMASVAGDEPTQGWLPYESTTVKDCSQGFCSIYCPQWCYIVFPPPPPLDDLSDSSPSGGAAFSPLVIAIIGVLTCVFLLVSYYTIISKYCTNFESFGRRRTHAGDSQEADGSGTQLRHEALHVVASEGLDEDAIRLLATYKYRKRDWPLDCSDCSVCLSEFREDDALRLLPKCGHAFHVSCIDTWLKSHSNCPLCRAKIVPNCAAAAPPAPAQMPPPPPECQTSHPTDMIVLSVEAYERTEDETSGNMTSGSQVTADTRNRDGDRRHGRPSGRILEEEVIVVGGASPPSSSSSSAAG